MRIFDQKILEVTIEKSILLFLDIWVKFEILIDLILMKICSYSLQSDYLVSHQFTCK